VSAEALPQTQGLELRWDAERGAVMHEKVERLGALVLRRSSAHQAADPQAVSALLFAQVSNQPERALNWSSKATSFAERLRFCRAHGAEALPDPDDHQALLLQICAGRRSIADLRQADLADALRTGMDYQQTQLMDRWAPEQMTLPGGRRARVSYDDPTAPVVAARVQDFFGLESSPTLADGRAVAVCHLLAPNGRPAQITTDLAGFWDGSYAEVRKALRGRYPKHAWPEDPRLGRSS
jgi:ATP-dependent helicase HrpB